MVERNIYPELDELEFAAREYQTATEHLMAVLSKYENIPPRIATTLLALANAINQEWGG
jgi:hypothetical protein